MKRKTIEFRGQKTYINVGVYKESARLHIWASTQSGEKYEVTKDIPASLLYPGASIVVSIECRETGLQQKLKEAEILMGNVGYCGYNRKAYEILLFFFFLLREYDPENFDSLFEIIRLEDEEEMEAE